MISPVLEGIYRYWYVPHFPGDVFATRVASFFFFFRGVALFKSFTSTRRKKRFALEDFRLTGVNLAPKPVPLLWLGHLTAGCCEFRMFCSTRKVRGLVTPAFFSELGPQILAYIFRRVKQTALGPSLGQPFLQPVCREKAKCRFRPGCAFGVSKKQLVRGFSPKSAQLLPERNQIRGPRVGVSPKPQVEGLRFARNKWPVDPLPGGSGPGRRAWSRLNPDRCVFKASRALQQQRPQHNCRIL